MKPTEERLCDAHQIGGLISAMAQARGVCAAQAAAVHGRHSLTGCAAGGTAGP